MLVANCSWIGMRFLLVDAKCKIHDENGKVVSLNALPPGVFYDAPYDRFRCQGPSSCRGWSIAHCFVAQCNAKYSCYDAQLIENQGINCRGFAACQEAHLFHSHNVVCGMEAINACTKSIIESDTMVLCWGPFACVSDYEERILFKVGAKGFVRCNKGNGDMSCQHMDVEINHGHRACIADNIEDESQQHCAVVCEGSRECDKDTIKFIVST